MEQRSLQLVVAGYIRGNFKQSVQSANGKLGKDAINQFFLSVYTHTQIYTSNTQHS